MTTLIDAFKYITFGLVKPGYQFVWDNKECVVTQCRSTEIIFSTKPKNLPKNGHPPTRSYTCSRQFFMETIVKLYTFNRI